MHIRLTYHTHRHLYTQLPYPLKHQQDVAQQVQIALAVASTVASDDAVNPLTVAQQCSCDALSRGRHAYLLIGLVVE
jgi:hypothetical protein